MRDRVLSGRREFRPKEILPAATGAGSPFPKICDELTMILNRKPLKIRPGVK